MRIGTDASLSECYREGYLVMEYKKRELMPKGVFNKDCVVRFIEYIPEHLREKVFGDYYLTTDVSLSFNAVFEQYERYKESIDSSSGYTFQEPESEYDLLTLADNVNSYCGLR
jgi:hypothetical protein